VISEQLLTMSSSKVNTQTGEISESL